MSIRAVKYTRPAYRVMRVCAPLVDVSVLVLSCYLVMRVCAPLVRLTYCLMRVCAPLVDVTLLQFVSAWLAHFCTCTKTYSFTGKCLVNAGKSQAFSW